MRVLIDGNVILDVMQNRKPFVSSSSKVWKLCETNQVEGYVSALTFSNLVYVMRKELSADKISEVLKVLGLIFHFADLKTADLREAGELAWDDYEDALQFVTAKRIQADMIITRNVRDFQQSRIKVLTPSEYLKKAFDR